MHIYCHQGCGFPSVNLSKKRFKERNVCRKENLENLLTARQNTIGQPDLHFFRKRFHFIFSNVQHLWNDFQYKITRNWDIPRLFNVFYSTIRIQ